MEPKNATEPKGLLQTHELYKYIMDNNVYPRECKLLKELRALTATHPWSVMGTSPDAGQLIEILLKLVGAKKTIEIGVFTGYSLLLTALAIPEDGQIVAIDVDRDTYEIGLPVIRKGGVEHKINFIKSEGLPALLKLLEDPENEGSFDYAFVDADKTNYINYHELVMKLLKVNGIVVYDNTLWFGTVAQPEDSVPEGYRKGRTATVEFNKALAVDPRIDISTVPLGDGLTICRRLY